MAFQQEQITPYDNDTAKGEQVRRMFNNIAPTYDRLNRLLSLGLDRGWRRRATDAVAEAKPSRVLDVATGTGDFAMLIAKRLPNATVIGTDISEEMMAVAMQKAAGLGVSFQVADCLQLPFNAGEFNVVTIAFGIRNFQDLRQGLCEACRVLTTGGRLVILELSKPKRKVVQTLFWIYSHLWMPLVGRLISGDRHAYAYLTATVEVFPQAERLAEELKAAGFTAVTFRRMAFGVCTLYIAEK